MSRIDEDKFHQGATTARGLGTGAANAGMRPDAAPVFAADRFRRMLRSAAVDVPPGCAIAPPPLLPVQSPPIEPAESETATAGRAGEAVPHEPPDGHQPVILHEPPRQGQQTTPSPLPDPLRTPSQTAGREVNPISADSGPKGALLNKEGLISNLAQDTARLISSLFSRTERTFQTWTVTVPLDPASLPQSEVQLQVSPFRLVLRFRTQSTASAHLISSFKGQLLALLESNRSLPSTIDLELE